MRHPLILLSVSAVVGLLASSAVGFAQNGAGAPGGATANSVGSGATSSGPSGNSASIGSAGSAASGGSSASTLGLGSTSTNSEGTSSSIGTAGSAAGLQPESRSRVKNEPGNLDARSRARGEGTGDARSRSETRTRLHHGQLETETKTEARPAGGGKDVKSETRLRNGVPQ